MHKEGKINYIELPARDLAANKAFFRAVFAWEFTDYGRDYTAFNNAGMDGGFFKSEQSVITENGSALVVLYHHDLEACQQKIIEAGGKIIEPVFSFPGGKRFHFSDPSGNEFAVWSE